VSANSLNIGGTGYTFSGGAIAVGSGGITAAQSTSISSNITLGANQIWSAALTKTLTVGGNISGGTYALTVKGGGTTALGGTNSLNSLKVGDAAGIGSLTVAGGATAVGNSFDLASGTVNLNGGALAVGGVSHSVGTALATFNFNGGTLQATAAKSNFMAGLSNAYVREGGAKIDTQNFDISIGQALAHAGSAATDGGLLKTGGGKLTLTGAISYTGNTTIAEGALAIDNHQTTTLTTISGAGNLSIGSGSTLNAKSIDVNTLSIGSTGGAAAVPEPASMILLATAGILGGFALMRSHRK
jgi:autotransporter-associated beta strand protein